MASNSKKYVSLTRLSDFLDNLKSTFLKKSDYVIDTGLSSTSVNPVQNKVLDAEFDAISEAMGALELAIDGASETAAQKSQVQIITWGVDD